MIKDSIETRLRSGFRATAFCIAGSVALGAFVILPIADAIQDESSCSGSPLAATSDAFNHCPSGP